MMKKHRFPWLVGLAVSLLAVFLAGCRIQAVNDDPVPPKAVRIIKKLDSRIASLTEFTPKIVMAETIVLKAAEKRGTVGDVCDALDVVSPNLERELRQLQIRPTVNDKQTISVLKDVIRGFSEVKALLECGQAAAQ